MQTFEEIKAYLRQFAKDRDWEKFHSPKNLSMALSVEAAELLEHFQWLTEAQSEQLDEELKQKVAEEIADIQLYLIRLADRLNIDLAEAIKHKSKINEKNYPVDKAYGSAKKHRDY